MGRGRDRVADPRLAAPYFEALRELGLSSGQIGEVGAVALKDDLVFSDAYDSIALQLEQAGYEVARIPILHTVDRLLLTWTNAIVERSGAARRVWLPAYGVPILDRMAQQIWQDEGFEVLTIPCQHIIPWGGALRCLTNVIEPTRDLKR